MQELTEIIDNVPKTGFWAGVAVLGTTIGLILKNVFPFFQSKSDNKLIRERCKSLEMRVKELEAEVKGLREMESNYLQLRGAVSVMKRKLEEAGFSDIPGL